VLTAIRANASSWSSGICSSCRNAAAISASSAGSGIEMGKPLTATFSPPALFIWAVNAATNSAMPALSLLVGLPADTEGVGVKLDGAAVVSVGFNVGC